MKKILVMILFGIAFLGMTAANDFEKSNLSGKVNVINEESWQVVRKNGVYAKELLETEYHYTYEYDRFGNWTKKTKSKKISRFEKDYLEPQTFTFREITYHP